MPARLDILVEIVDAGRLRDVERCVHNVLPNDPTAFVLTFERGVYAARVNADDDTVELVRGRLALDREHSVSSCGPSAPWRTALGRGVRWGWILRNQQGYPDAVQLDFANPDETRGVVIQLCAIASRFRLFELTPRD